MTKRELAAQFAKIDNARNDKELSSICSLCSTTSDANVTNAFTKIARKIKCPTSYIKTSAAWFTKLNALTLSEIHCILEFIQSETCHEDSIAENPVKTTQHRNFNTDLVVENESRNHHNTAVLSNRISKKLENEKKSENMPVKQTKETVSDTAGNKHEVLSHKVISLECVKLEPELMCEYDVNSWYHKELSKLEQEYSRHEQFRRKRAQLRMLYWTYLDRIRNDAVPTVINC